MLPSERRLGPQVVVVGFTAVMIAIVLLADPFGSLDGIGRVMVLAALLAMAGAAAGAVREIRSGRFGAEDRRVDEHAQHSAGRYRRMWLRGLPAVPLLALLFTLVFMNQPPAGGPWTRWEVFSTRDFVFWLVDVLLLWTLLVCCVAVVRSRGAPWEATVLVCAIPGLLALTVLPAIRKIDCPSQIPRDDMLDPLPPRTYVIEGESEDWRGTESRSLTIQSDGEDSEVLEARVGEWYRSEGWRSSSIDGSAGVELEAGDWRLSIHGMKDYQAPGEPTNLGVGLYLSHSDAGCDWLS